ncbi:unnamed protein product [Lampetra planeri]
MEVDGSGYRRARKKAIKEGLEFLQSPLPFAGSDEEYKGYLHRLVCGLRDEGNQLYREGQALRAHEMYSEALGVCAYMHDIEGFPSESGVVEKLYVNRATCLLGMSQYNDALLDCEEALHRNKMSHKALYRKAKALKAIGKPKEAYEVAVQCSCIISNDQEVFKLVQELAVSLGLRVRKAYVRTQVCACLRACLLGTSLHPCLAWATGHADAGYTEATSQTEPVSSGLSPYADYAPANDAHPAANGVAGAYADTAEGVKAPACEPYDGASLGDGSEEGSAERFGDAAESEGDSDRSVGDGNGDGNGAHPRSELSHAEDELPAGSLAAEPAVGLARPTSAAGSPASLVAQPKKSEPSSELFPKIKRADGAAPPGDAFRPQRKPAETAADGAHMKRNAAAVADVHGSMAAVDGSILSLVRNPLESTHEFRQACHLCILGADRSACNTEHKCKKDFLLCRLKSMPNRQWQKVRPRPMKSYSGVYMLCKDIVQGEECRFAGHCTFAYSQEEIDVWTQERKGTLNRNLLFDPFGGGGGGGTGCGTGGGTGGFGGENSLQGSEGGDFSVAGLLRAHGGMFMFYCEECFDKRPRVISKRNKEALKYCTHNPPHIFDEKKCLVHILRGTSVRHLKIRPLHEMCQFDLCRHETRFGCNRQDSCYFAHDIIELKIWVLQSKNGLSQEDITQESKRYLQSLDSPGPNAGNQGMSKPPASTKLQLKLKFVCSQCWKNGQVSEADRNLRYCEAKARHSWTKDRRALLAMSPQRKKWISVRAPPSMRVAPTHYEVCAHVLNGKKCFYIGNCNFAHSEEEREVWMYMKSNCLTDIDEVYKMWLEGNRTPAKDPEDGTSPAGKESSSRICMPTDYAENSGKYCSLCGRNCNSDKQWRQHMSSEKHREKVFEDEQRWKFRFPTGQFAVCERLGSAGGCKDDGCAYAHGDKELDEWIERRDAIRAKLEEARQQGLLPLNESNFGKYTCLIK